MSRGNDNNVTSQSLELVARFSQEGEDIAVDRKLLKTHLFRVVFL